MGDHLKIEKIEDGQDSSIRELLQSRVAQEMDVEVSFYAVEGVQSISELKIDQDKL